MKRTSIKRWLGACLLGSALFGGCEGPDPRPVAMNRYQPAALAAPKPEIQGVSDLGSAAPATAPNAMESLPAPIFPPPSTAPGTQSAANPEENNGRQQANFADIAPALLQQQAQMPPPGDTGSASAEVRQPSSPGHAEDYGWLCGEVQYDHISKGWRLRYAGLDEADRWGGAVILVADGSLESLKDGQIIRVRGSMINPDARKSGPAYRVESIAIVEGTGKSIMP